MNLGKKIGFFSAFILPFLLLLGSYPQGYGYYLPLIFSFVFLPIIDFLVGEDKTNVPDDKIAFISKEKYYKIVLFIWVFVQTGILTWCFYHITYKHLETYEWIGFILGASYVTGGIGITVAHELGHKNLKLQRFYSKVLLMQVCYMHFIIEHNQGHHVHVATPVDPATARKGENFYAFWVKSVFIGYFHAWQIEIKRLEKIGINKVSIQNRMIWYTLAPILFAGIFTLFFSIVSGRIVFEIPIFFFAQSLFGFTLLEHVNYIEHYGITRKEIEPGKFERVTPQHSWNANHLLSNFFLFQLQRHSDHHINATKPYQVLKQYDESPQLPAGYPTMVILSLLPPFWFRVMDKRLENHLQLAGKSVA